MLLYIIRHGETDWNTAGRLQGGADIPLNENGRNLARVTGEALRRVPFDLMITSPLKRARETGELVIAPSEKHFGRKIPVIEDERLKELSWGSWEGLGCLEENFAIPDKNFNLFYTDALRFEGAPDGESVADLCDRTAEFWQELIHKPEYQDKIILISTHGCAMRALMNPLYDDPADFWQGHVPFNCMVNVVEVKDGSAQIVLGDKIYYDRSLCVDNYKAVQPDKKA